MALTHVYIEPLLVAQESGEILELPASKSGVQKYIDKSMWEKSRTLAKFVKNRQKELDNMDEEQQQEMQQFSDNFRAITPTSNYDAAFAQLWGGGKAGKDKDKEENKKGEKPKRDPLEKLEDDPYTKRGDVKVWCETAVTKLEGSEGKGKKSKYWTPKLAKELTGHKDGLRQQVKLLTKIYQQRKLETSKVKEQCQEALKDLKTSNTFMTQNNKILEK